MHLDGKTALVTGGSRGIGRAIALKLASEGAAVAINYAGNAKAAEDVKAAIEAAGGKAMVVQADVSNGESVEAMVKEVVDAFGGIDILVPDDVVIKTKTTSVFGGVENKKNLKDNKEAKTIYINATCIFGGVDIK